MRLSVTLLLLAILPAILIGCTTSPGQNKAGFLSKEQVLKLNPDADIVEFEDRVYQAGIDWVEEEALSKGEQLGEIREGMANKLPAGAIIIAPNERRDILIVEYDGKEKRYLLQVGE
ncbi:hypothetical protein [Evansella cellulosilytica]|uniref:Lipoprotein n=1 Tax=Evansella cellulosilytica (strain ATCC 21833 / DSM 2522 / FERM P-1141 / JCM 9156 / N-4) TaxID=649639 RepID=E6U1G5_EVAC2|nr:hypothetical protein [Evansella cellulosilytica]ADU29212.1 hypothetical protein Bcell_0936 [Evansella cellulosilytica DSM 2522]